MDEYNSEDTPLLQRHALLLRYTTTRKCVSSKSALLILLWSFVLGLLNGLFLNPDVYLSSFTMSFTLAGYVWVALILCFYPLAGLLADTKWGRYKESVLGYGYNTFICSSRWSMHCRYIHH